MGKEKDFSMFIKSGHVLYCFSCVVNSRLKVFGKNGKIKLTEKLAILQYTYHKHALDGSLTTRQDAIQSFQFNSIQIDYLYFILIL